MTNRCLTTTARTYNYSYLTSTSYTSRYLYNRLSSAGVTDGTSTITLATLTYDQGTLTSVTGLREWDTNAQYVTARGNVTTSADLSGTKTFAYDWAGNVTSTTVNGVTATVTTSVFFWYRKGYDTSGLPSVGRLIDTINNTSFYGLP